MNKSVLNFKSKFPKITYSYSLIIFYLKEEVDGIDRYSIRTICRTVADNYVAFSACFRRTFENSSVRKRVDQRNCG